MKFKSITSLLFLAMTILINCGSKTGKQNEKLEDVFRTNYGKIDDRNLKLKFGDLVEFNIDEQKIYAVVLDIKQEERINWFGICFLNKDQFFGRRIPHGFGGQCDDLCDLTYLNEKGLSNFKVLKNLKINFDIVSPGSDSPAVNLVEVFRDYNDGLKQRTKKETPCEEKLKMMEPINECYYPLNKIL